VNRVNKNIDHIGSILLLGLLTVLLAPDTRAQQRPQFTQYISNELIINPAYAGAEEALSITLVHRSQWSDVDGAPSTQTFTAHSLFKSKKIGLGLAVINDKIGIHNVLNASTSYAYHIALNSETSLSLGLQFGLNQKRSDYNSLANQVQVANDPTLYAADLSTTNFEFGSGLFLKSPRLSIGLSAPNMLPEKTFINDSLDFSLSNNNYYFLGRYKIPVNNNIHFQPGLLLKYHPGLPMSYDANLAMVINEVLILGLSYRDMESLNGIVQAKITPQLKIGYSFDYPLGNDAGIQSNSHEFMVNYLFRFSNFQISRPR